MVYLDVQMVSLFDWFCQVLYYEFNLIHVELNLSQHLVIQYNKFKEMLTLRMKCLHLNSHYVSRILSSKNLCARSTRVLFSTDVFTTDISAVGFDDYALGVQKDVLEVPSHFNFAENVLENWREKETVLFSSVNLYKLIYYLFSYIRR